MQCKKVHVISNEAPHHVFIAMTKTKQPITLLSLFKFTHTLQRCNWTKVSRQRFARSSLAFDFCYVDVDNGNSRLPMPTFEPHKRQHWRWKKKDKTTLETTKQFLIVQIKYVLSIKERKKKYIVLFFDYDVLSSPFHVSVVVFSNYYFIFFIEVEPQERLNSDHTHAHIWPFCLFITLTPAPFLVCLSIFSSQSKSNTSGAKPTHPIQIQSSFPFCLCFFHRIN